MTTNKAYGKSGHRDAHLQMSDVQIGGRQGTLHFIRFPTSQVSTLWGHSHMVLDDFGSFLTQLPTLIRYSTT